MRNCLLMMKFASTCQISDMGVVWGLPCLHPNTIKPSYFCFYFACIIIATLSVCLQGFQSGLVPGTFTRLRSCIVPAEITEPPKISGGENHKYEDR